MKRMALPQEYASHGYSWQGWLLDDHSLKFLEITETQQAKGEFLYFTTHYLATEGIFKA